MSNDETDYSFVKTGRQKHKDLRQSGSLPENLEGYQEKF
jgi:hypothetical protein